MKQSIYVVLYAFIILSPLMASAEPGNTRYESFNRAKKILAHDVYFDHRITFYCEADFDDHGKVTLPEGFFTTKYTGRTEKIEWEHVVPAENFGRTFVEWREGDPLCVTRRGDTFKGRRCAEKVNHEYRFMQSDMYNLVPAIGAVNAMRQNYNFQMLPEASPDFGSCPMKIEGNKVEPPAHTRGQIARIYKYMAWAYPRYRISEQQGKLMDAWDRQFPVDAWECTRARRIEHIQGNENPFISKPCAAAGM